MSVLQMVGALTQRLVKSNPVVPMRSKAATSRAMAGLARMMGAGFSNSGLFRSIKYHDAVEDAYKSVVWVYACVRTISDACAAPPWKAYSVRKSGTLKPLPGHELEEMFKNPNPFTSQSDLVRDWATDLQLAGLSFWEMVFVQRKPYRLYRIRPDHLHAKPDARNLVASFEFDPGGIEPVSFLPQEIVSFRYLDPLDPLGAIAPVEAARRVIQTQNAAEVWNKAIFDNMAVPGGILKIPAEVLDHEDRAVVKEELLSEYTRDRVGRPMVLWGGMEWETIALEHAKVDFSSQMDSHKLSVCAVLRVPPVLVGANPDPTYSNYSVSRIAFWEDFVIPHLEWMQGTLNQRVAPFYSRAEGNKNGQIELRYDLSNIPAMRDSFIARIDTATKMWSIGCTRNEINKRLSLGLEDVEWGNAWWAPPMVQPITEETFTALLEYEEEPVQDPTAPVDDPNDDDTTDVPDDPEDDTTADDTAPDAEDEAKSKKERALLRMRRRKPRKPIVY